MRFLDLEEDDRPMGPIEFTKRALQVAACIAAVFGITAAILSLGLS